MTAVQAPERITAVLFDFAGVITSSPWGALTAAGGGNLELLIGPYEEDGDHPWHQVERGELVQAGFDPAVVERVTRLVDVAEYKRRQNPPGPRLTPKAFGKDRRMPITNGYRG